MTDDFFWLTLCNNRAIARALNTASNNCILLIGYVHNWSSCAACDIDIWWLKREKRLGLFIDWCRASWPYTIVSHYYFHNLKSAKISRTRSFWFTVGFEQIQLFKCYVEYCVQCMKGGKSRCRSFTCMTKIPDTWEYTGCIRNICDASRRQEYNRIHWEKI